MNIRDTKELERLIPDYLNGHAGSHVNNAIEAQMRNDEKFRLLVEAERGLLDGVRGQTLSTKASPDFSALENKIASRQGWMNPGSGKWAFSAAFALVLMFGAGTWFNKNVAFNDFETLSNAPVVYEQTTLRVIGNENISHDEYQAIFKQYELDVLNKFPSVNVYDVSPSKNQEISDLVETLNADDRFRIVRLMEKSP